jgi:peptide/nickel transport system substrate-binding protein
MRDPKTFEYRPGLATDWQPSADYKSWTFHLRQGVKFHENWGELTGEDVKFTVEQNLRPNAQGGSAHSSAPSSTASSYPSRIP